MKGGMIRLLDIVASLGLVVLGGGLVYVSALETNLADRLYETLGKAPIWGVALGLFLVLAVILRLLAHRKPREKDRYIDFESDGGSVGISTKAIRDFIEQICREFSGVKSVETQLVQEKGALDIHISAKVAAGNRIPELSRELQQRVRESVRESLGVEEIRNITIKVREIVGSSATPAPVD